MSECRALVNFCGNAVATLFIAWWDRSLDVDRVRRVFNGEEVPPVAVESAEEHHGTETGPDAQTAGTQAGVAAAYVPASDGAPGAQVHATQGHDAGGRAEALAEATAR
jgi:aerobic C4-dicarboxylate transport protein